MGIFLLTFVSSFTTLGTFKKGTCIQLHQICDDCNYVNLTSVTFPNSTIRNLNELMTKNGNDYNYSWCNTTDIGSYLYNTCGDYEGTHTCENIGFEINAIGFESTDARSDATSRGIYFILGMSALFFTGFLLTEKELYKWSFFLLFALFFCIGSNLVFISIYNEIGDTQLGSVFDKLAAISSYLYWFCFGLLIFMWVFTTLASLADNQRMKQAEAVGSQTNFRY